MWIFITLLWRITSRLLRRLGWGSLLVPVAVLGVAVFGITLLTVAAVALAVILVIRRPGTAAGLLPVTLVCAGIWGLALAAATPGMATWTAMPFGAPSWMAVTLAPNGHGKVVKYGTAPVPVKAANQAGVPVFTVNVKVDEDALKSQNARIVQYLGADNVAGGKQTAQQVLKDLGGDPKMTIGFVTEPDEVPTQLRDQGFEKAIKSDPNAKVVAKVDGNVKPDDSLKAPSEMLSGNPGINLIYTSTGPATFGALKALPKNSQVKVFGFCAADQPLNQTYPGCVAQEPERYGRMVVQQVRSFINGKTPKAEILLPLKLFVSGQTPAAGEVG